MEKTFTFDMASKAYADYILNSKDRVRSAYCGDT